MQKYNILTKEFNFIPVYKIGNQVLLMRINQGIKHYSVIDKVTGRLSFIYPPNFKLFATVDCFDFFHKRIVKNFGN